MRWTAALACLVLMVTSACGASPDTHESTTSTWVRAETGAGLVPGEGVVPAVGPRDERVAAPPLAGTDRWRMTRFAEDGQIEGYSTAASGVPGTRLGLKVSTSARSFKVFAYRLGAYDGGTGHLVWTSPAVPGTRQADAVLEACGDPHRGGAVAARA